MLLRVKERSGAVSCCNIGQFQNRGSRVKRSRVRCRSITGQRRRRYGSGVGWLGGIGGRRSGFVELATFSPSPSASLSTQVVVERSHLRRGGGEVPKASHHRSLVGNQFMATEPLGSVLSTSRAGALGLEGRIPEAMQADESMLALHIGSGGIGGIVR